MKIIMKLELTSRENWQMKLKDLKFDHMKKKN